MKTIYKASDGTIFANSEDCLRYENSGKDLNLSQTVKWYNDKGERLDITKLSVTNIAVNVYGFKTTPKTDLVRLFDYTKNVLHWCYADEISELKANELYFFPFYSTDLTTKEILHQRYLDNLKMYDTINKNE